MPFGPIRLALTALAMGLSTNLIQAQDIEKPKPEKPVAGAVDTKATAAAPSKEDMQRRRLAMSIVRQRMIAKFLHEAKVPGETGQLEPALCDSDYEGLMRELKMAERKLKQKKKPLFVYRALLGNRLNSAALRVIEHKPIDAKGLALFLDQTIDLYNEGQNLLDSRMLDMKFRPGTKQIAQWLKQGLLDPSFMAGISEEQKHKAMALTLLHYSYIRGKLDQATALGNLRNLHAEKETEALADLRDRVKDLKPDELRAALVDLVDLSCALGRVTERDTSKIKSTYIHGVDDSELLNKALDILDTYEAENRRDADSRRDDKENRESIITWLLYEQMISPSERVKLEGSGIEAIREFSDKAIQRSELLDDLRKAAKTIRHKPAYEHGFKPRIRKALKNNGFDTDIDKAIENLKMLILEIEVFAQGLMIAASNSLETQAVEYQESRV